MRISHFFKKLYSSLLPYQCVLCSHVSDRQQDLCQSCYNELPILTDFSPACSEILSENTYILFRYEYPITHLVLSLKFNQTLVYGKILGELLVEKIREDWYADQPLPDVIIPMPLHSKRLKERGFNQAVEIARPISRAFDLPLDLHSCTRKKATAAQAKLSAEKRKQNLKNAFLIQEDFTGKHVAVLDDVMTTGSTLLEITRKLREAGAKRIDIWCCARAIMKHIT